MKLLLILTIVITLTGCPSVGTIASYMPTSECGKVLYDRDNAREAGKEIVIHAVCPK
jgi:uncharacterized protein YceK